MNARKLILLTILLSLAIPLQSAWTATIPAGTIIVVKTSHTINSKDPSGRKFKAQLAQGIGVNGKVVVPAGTSVGGVIKSPSFTVGSTTRPLTLRLSELAINKRVITIKTDDFEADNSSPWFTRRGIHVTGSSFLLHSGTLLGFRLAQPVEI